MSVDLGLSGISLIIGLASLGPHKNVQWESVIKSLCVYLRIYVCTYVCMYSGGGGIGGFLRGASAFCHNGSCGLDDTVVEQ